MYVYLNNSPHRIFCWQISVFARKDVSFLYILPFNFGDFCFIFVYQAFNSVQALIQSPGNETYRRIGTRRRMLLHPL